MIPFTFQLSEKGNKVNFYLRLKCKSISKILMTFAPNQIKCHANTDVIPGLYGGQMSFIPAVGNQQLAVEI